MLSQSSFAVVFEKARCVRKGIAFVRIVQFTDPEEIRRAGVVLDEHSIDVLAGEQTVYGLAQRAVKERRSLAQLLSDQEIAQRIDYAELASAGLLRCAQVGEGDAG